MKNREYWRQRFTLLEEAQNKNANQYLDTLKEEYEKSLLRIEKDITNWYARLADNNEISYSNAIKLLEKKELKEFKWTVEEYIQKGKENALNQQWVTELENASAKVHIEKLEAIKIQIQNELEQLYNKQNEGVTSLVKQQYQDAYYKSTYEIQKGLERYWNIQPLNTNKIEKIISKPWTTDSRTFSDRIWDNKNELIKTLQTELTQATIRGDSLDDVIRNISKKFNVAKNRASTLVMTESAFFSSVGQKECFNNLGVKKYEIVATLDSHTSEICQELDGKVFDMKNYQVGITAPPFHVNCRTVTVPYFDDEFTVGEKRAYRDGNGKTRHVDSKMKYKEWKEKYVNQKPKHKANENHEQSYTKPQLEKIAKEAEDIVNKYANNQSKWSGNIILTENRVAKEWNCNISVDQYTSLDMMIHEHLHAHSISYYDKQTYINNWKIEEATVQLFTQEICKANEINFVVSQYDNMVDTLRKINQKAKLYKNDFEFAKELFNTPITNRLDFLEESIYNRVGKDITIEGYQKISKLLEEF